jgi:hypothetical protein
MTDSVIGRRASVSDTQTARPGTVQVVAYVPSDVDGSPWVLASRVADVLAHAGIVGALVYVHGHDAATRAIHVEIHDQHRPPRWQPLVTAAVETAGGRHGEFFTVTTRPAT